MRYEILIPVLSSTATTVNHWTAGQFPDKPEVKVKLGGWTLTGPDTVALTTTFCNGAVVRLKPYCSEPADSTTDSWSGGSGHNLIAAKSSSTTSSDTCAGDTT
eukprot:SAG31_NODE_448_length_15557_cov_5.101760_4_plen_103_part_00